MAKVQESETSVLATALGLHGEYKPEEQPLFTGSLTQSQQDALDANQAILPQATNFARDINTANTAELLRMMESMLPGYMGMLTKGLTTSASLMRGEIPADVLRAISDRAASRGISSGTSGSQFGQYGELRNIGITSLEAQQQGLNQFLNIAQRAPKAPMYDFTSMFISPAQHFNAALQVYNTNLPVQLYNEWARNQPGNLERATGALLDWVATEGTSVLNMYMGGMMGGGGGGGMGGMMGGGGGGGGGAEAGGNWYQAGPQGIPQGANAGTGEGGPMSYGGSPGMDSYFNSPYFG